MRSRDMLIPFGSLRNFGLPALEQMFESLPFLRHQNGNWVPDVEITEDAQGYTVRMEVPGLSPEDVEVRLTGDLLTIKGEKCEQSRNESETVHVTERRYGAFERSFTLASAVDAKHVEAETKDGLLVVRVPKAQEAQSHRVEIKKS